MVIDHRSLVTDHRSLVTMTGSLVTDHGSLVTGTYAPVTGQFRRSVRLLTAAAVCQRVCFDAVSAVHAGGTSLLIGPDVFLMAASG